MDFTTRVQKIRELGFRDSSDLYAGCPMIYDCKICHGIADTRPETYDPRDYSKPKDICPACKREMKKLFTTEKKLMGIVKEVEKMIPYKKDETRGQEASWRWLSEMRELSK